MPKRVKPKIDGMYYERTPIQKVIFREAVPRGIRRIWRKMRGLGYRG